MLKQSRNWNCDKTLSSIINNANTFLINSKNIFIHKVNNVYYCLLLTPEGVEYIGESFISEESIGDMYYIRKNISELDSFCFL